MIFSRPGRSPLMFLSELQVKGFRLFKDPAIVKLHRGLNLLVGENGCGKSSIVDAIRILLNESEFFHRGLREEDFYQASSGGALPTLLISVSGIFSDLDDTQRVEYLTWLTPQFDAKLNVEYQYNVDSRRLLKPKRWGGNSCNSIFDWEPLEDIQCIYLPALRDAERSLRSGRGSRLSRFIINLSADELAQRRKDHKKMPLEDEVYQFNRTAAEQEDIKKANELINSSLKNAVGTIFGQSTRIQFNEPSYERIVEALQIMFSKSVGCTELESFKNLSENSLGYNNLIYIATILAEFEGLKDQYTTPRILLVEELEAHLHPQLQIKLLKYLSQQALDYGIQVIITTHSATLAAVVPIDQIISVHRTTGGALIIPIKDCGIENPAKAFLNRWIDATKSTLLFSKGNVFVEGIAEAILIPKLAEVYLKQYATTHDIEISSLEDAGISVINMNGIYFQYFTQLYNGYTICIPERQEGELKKDYENRIKEFRQKPRFNDNEYTKTLALPIRCAVLTDNDPPCLVETHTDAETGKRSVFRWEQKPTKQEPIEGSNPQLYLLAQLANMTDNCRVFSNLKTFEYDLAIESHYNARLMLEILVEWISTDGAIKATLVHYLDELGKEQDGEPFEVDDAQMALDILHQADKLGKGLFAQLLCERIDSAFIVPLYIAQSIRFILGLED